MDLNEAKLLTKALHKFSCYSCSLRWATRPGTYCALCTLLEASYCLAIQKLSSSFLHKCCGFSPHWTHSVNCFIGKTILIILAQTITDKIIENNRALFFITISLGLVTFSGSYWPPKQWVNEWMYLCLDGQMKRWVVKRTNQAHVYPLHIYNFNHFSSQCSLWQTTPPTSSSKMHFDYNATWGAASTCKLVTSTLKSWHWFDL